MSIPVFLQQLQSLKKELLKPERAPSHEIALVLNKARQSLQQNEMKWRDLDPSSSLFSKEFYLQQVIQARGPILKVESQDSTFPTGVLVHRSRSSLWTRLTLEKIPAALTAQNLVLWEVNSAQKPWAEWVRSVFVEAGLSPGSLQVFVSDLESEPLLWGHPGIRALQIFDPQFDFTKVVGNWFEKKWQVHRGGKSTALVLAEANLEEAARGIVQSVREGWGTHSWNISRVIVLEGVEKAFLEILRIEIEKQTQTLPSSLKSVLEKNLETFTAQQARRFGANPSFGFLENVSNCEEAHQLELGSPVVFLMSVRYPHDCIKWVNNLPNSVGVQIWANEERAMKMSRKLETSRVWINGWLQAQDSLFQGVKASIFGDCDEQVFGSYLSEQRSIDGRPSKNPH